MKNFCLLSEAPVRKGKPRKHWQSLAEMPDEAIRINLAMLQADMERLAGSGYFEMADWDSMLDLKLAWEGELNRRGEARR